MHFYSHSIGIERFCASTMEGNLHFLQLWPRIRDASASLPTEVGIGTPLQADKKVDAATFGNNDEKREEHG